MKNQILILILLFVLIIIHLNKAAWFLYLFVFLLFSFIIFLGVANMDFHWFLKSYIHNPEMKERKIALTFDDGPTEVTPRFLEILEKFNQKATFFCIGKQIEKYPEIFKKTIKNGHEVGNHSYSHSNKIGFFSTRKMISEIENCDAAILKFGNIKTNLYRPPFGITNPNIAKAIRKTGKKSIGWSIRSFDTAIHNETKILKRIIPNIKPGCVILLHDNSEKTLYVLEQILLFLEQENYQSVTISELYNFEK